MEIINVRHSTGSAIAHGLRDDCYGTMMDIRPMDAPDYIPTGSHVGRSGPTPYLQHLYFVSAEDLRGMPY